MTPEQARHLVARLVDHFHWHLAPWGWELYCDTFEAYPLPVGRMAVGTLEAREVRFPEIDTLADALEAEAAHWAATDDSEPAEVASPDVAKSHLADARRALGQS